ncbi:MAG: hypothetical protein NC398_06425 [Acetatifactor muris]|nr:hypothetical protein [Acetatifactor muris]MCM1526616.1 hypothetical protein [Bacteroides sp.]
MGKRKLKGLLERKGINITIGNVIFAGVAETSVDLEYYPDDGFLSIEAVITTGDRKNSNKEWIDITSYGQQMLDLEDIATLSEIADAIGNAKWRYDIGEMSADGEPFSYKKMRQAILNRLYNAKTEFPQFIAEQLQSGKYADITDSEGWTDLYEFANRYCEEYRIGTPRALLRDLPNVDSRFELKDNEPRTVMLSNNRPMQLAAEKPLIRMR